MNFRVWVKRGIQNAYFIFNISSIFKDTNLFRKSTNKTPDLRRCVFRYTIIIIL